MWSEPEIDCYQHGEPEARLGYPDLFRTAEGGWLLTETGKVPARLHALPPSLVQQRWYTKARDANVTHTFAAPVPAPVVSPPVSLFNRSSTTLDVFVAPLHVLAEETEETAACVGYRQEGRGVTLTVFINGSAVADLSDGVASVRLQLQCSQSLTEASR